MAGFYWCVIFLMLCRHFNLKHIFHSILHHPLGPRHPPKKPWLESAVSNEKPQAALGQIDTPEMAELGMHFGQFQELDAGGKNLRAKVMSRKAWKKHVLLLMVQKSVPTSWYGKYPIICRVLIHPRWCRISSINSIMRYIQIMDTLKRLDRPLL